ncbi:DUF3797 domain-containing protein [Bacillus cereus]|uniref:DUF3797 domain-containing protein n=1 Tax=Bacillus cereus TaxID=1396 RepID=UPI000B4B215C|nr:DUF3797 domain-containing protein [Bacillus cereus]
MNSMDYLRISPLINDCPNCGNQIVGNGEGTLEVDDNVISRTCKCGFNFKYDVNTGVIKKKIKQVINEAIKSCNKSGNN